LSSAFQISASAFFAPGWADLGSALSTLPILWTSCRIRHEVHYAEQRIMPSGGHEPLKQKDLRLLKSA
jgi:hypothetical protein